MSSRVGVNLRASAYLHQGDRKYMEDEFQVAYQRTHDKKDIEYAFFGIFDGHGGKEAAHFAKDNLMDNIVSLRAFWSDDDEDVLAAIKEGFLQTHMAMWKVLGEWRGGGRRKQTDIFSRTLFLADFSLNLPRFSGRLYFLWPLKLIVS